MMKIIFHILLLTNGQVSRLRKAFQNNYSADIKLSKTQLHEIVLSGEFLCRLSEPSLIGNVLKRLAKSVLIPLEMTTTASATDAAIHKKMSCSGFTTLITSNEEMEDIMKKIKCLEESGLLIKVVSETIKNVAKEQKRELLRML